MNMCCKLVGLLDPSQGFGALPALLHMSTCAPPPPSILLFQSSSRLVNWLRKTVRTYLAASEIWLCFARTHESPGGAEWHSLSIWLN